MLYEVVNLGPAAKYDENVLWIAAVAIVLIGVAAFFLSASLNRIKLGMAAILLMVGGFMVLRYHLDQSREFEKADFEERLVAAFQGAGYGQINIWFDVETFSGFDGDGELRHGCYKDIDHNQILIVPSGLDAEGRCIVLLVTPDTGT